MVSPRLPFQATPIVGRERERATLSHLLRQPHVRLITLTGAGGVGKTRLALQLATELLPDFEDGVAFVPLDSISDSTLVLNVVAHEIGIREAGARSSVEQLTHFLQDKEMLLLLDNFEHVLSAASDLHTLLHLCPRVKLLITSREALRLRGEHEFPVPTLDLPNPDISALDILARNDAITLFLQRAQAVLPDFALTPQNASVVAELCTRLDGLPLAIELAAARIKFLTPQEILSRLNHSLTMLVGGTRDLPTRLQTLSNAIAWSYDLLGITERVLFRRLALFVGGCTLETAQMVGGVEDGHEFLQQLESLVNKSLLRRLETLDGKLRFRMLESVREFALEQLERSGELTQARQAYIACFLERAQEAEPHLLGSELEVWLNRLEAEHDNLRSALTQLLEQGDVELALKIAGTLWRFWLARGYLTEGKRRFESAIEHSHERNEVWAKALCGAGILSNYLGDSQTAEKWLGKALEYYHQTDDKRGTSIALNGLTHALCNRGDYARAEPLGEESVTLARQAGDQWGLANALWYMGNVTWQQGQYDHSRTFLEESIQLHRALNNESGLIYAQLNLAFVDTDTGHVARSQQACQRMLETFTALADRRGVTRALFGLGYAADVRGNLVEALGYYQECVQRLYELGDRWYTALLLELIAGIAVKSAQWLPAARLFGATEALREVIHCPIVPRSRATIQQQVEILQSRLGESAFTVAWSEGRTWTLQQTVAHACLLTLPITAQPTPQAHEGLTRRELEVLRLVATGLTNQQIAEQLIISPRTVHTHLNTIFSKLHVSSRTSATRYVIDHHLL